MTSGFAINKRRLVEAKQSSEAGSFLSKDGNTYNYEAGDWILNDVGGPNRWTVKGDIFRESYEVDGLFYAKLPTRIGWEIAEQDGVVESLEGPQNYAEGDYIITGIRGEKWTVTPKRFNQIYAIVE